MQKIDCLIVGGGICGRLLQLELEQQGKSTLVYDTPQSNHCTTVAAGLANPLVGKFFTIGWRAAEIFPSLALYYQSLEKRLHSSFFRSINYKRIISSAGEQNIWLSKAHKAKYNGFCSFANENVNGLNTQFGVLNVQQGGEMNTRVFLAACEGLLATRFESFDLSSLDLQSKQYQDLQYENIIFAEGYKVTDNPMWNDHVKIIPTKGELLVLETDLEPKGDIYLGSVYLQHLRDKIWRAGSTYARNDSTLNPTDMMRDDLTDKLDKVMTIPYKIVDHYCGVRPAALDRKPIVGRHPFYDQVYILNGMGSKAVSMAPLLVAELVRHIYLGTDINESVNLQRF
jgi:glycine oxidase